MTSGHMISLHTTSVRSMLPTFGIFQRFHSQLPLSFKVLVPGVESNFFFAARISTLACRRFPVIAGNFLWIILEAS